MPRGRGPAPLTAYWAYILDYSKCSGQLPYEVADGPADVVWQLMCPQGRQRYKDLVKDFKQQHGREAANRYREAAPQHDWQPRCKESPQQCRFQTRDLAPRAGRRWQRVSPPARRPSPHHRTEHDPLIMDLDNLDPVDHRQITFSDLSVDYPPIKWDVPSTRWWKIGRREDNTIHNKEMRSTSLHISTLLILNLCMLPQKF